MRQADDEALVLALDEGSTGVRAMLLDRAGTPRRMAYRETLPDHPGPGLVEHDAESLFAATAAVIAEVLAGVEPPRVRGLGIATQRGSAVVWDAATGRAAHPILSWQDGRTAARCHALMAEGHFVSPLHASTKIEWLLDRVDPQREATHAGRLRCGTVDAWLAWRLSAGGASATDASNASCSGLYDLFAHRWHESLLDVLRIPLASLPQIVDSSAVVGTLALDGLPRIPLAALIGDQQAAMMGQLRLAPGEAKITYGTSAMIDLNVGAEPVFSMHGAYPLVLWQRQGTPTFCLEGTAITAGAAITWLRDGLGIIRSSSEIESLAAGAADSGGVYFVPAFAGLGSPHWDPYARGAILGLTRGSTAAHVARAALESIAYQSADLLHAMEADSGTKLAEMRVDGGADRDEEASRQQQVSDHSYLRASIGLRPAALRAG